MRDHIASLEQRTFLRYAVGVAIGLCVTMLLFLLMQKLIESDRSGYSESPKGDLLSLVRLLEEPPPVTRERPKKPPEVKEPPLVDPFKPTGGTACKGFDCGVSLDPPQPDPPVVTGNRVETDGEYLPILKVAPVYPRRAASRGIQGHVLLEFTVTALGSVRDPVVLDASPPGVFDRAATDAALKFKYKPKVMNGQAMDVRGVRNLIRFQLDNG